MLYILFIQLSIVLCQDSDLKLRNVQIAVRHGIRTPMYLYPTERDYPFKYWAKYGGLGQLLPEGMRQMYEYGKYIRNDYSTFLSKYYDPKYVYVRSTDYDRTLMSAYTLLSGLYPPSDYQIWNNDILWQPIPVHTNENQLDPVLHEKGDCPRYDFLLNQYLNSKAHLDKQNENMEFLKAMRNYSNITDLNLFTIWKISDPTFVKAELNLTVPAWVVNSYDKLIELSDYLFYTDFFNVEMGKLNAGGLLYKIVQRMKDVANNATTNQISIYSIHDTYLAAMFRLLGMDQLVKHQSFAAAIIFELYISKSNGSHFVKVFQKNNSYSEAITKKQLKLPDCNSTVCKLDEFLASVSDKTVSDFTPLCSISYGVRVIATFSFKMVALVQIILYAFTIIIS